MEDEPYRPKGKGKGKGGKGGKAKGKGKRNFGRVQNRFLPLCVSQTPISGCCFFLFLLVLSFEIEDLCTCFSRFEENLISHIGHLRRAAPLKSEFWNKKARLSNV